MKKSPSKYLFIILLASVLLTTACSTVKVLKDGEFRLKDNDVIVTNAKSFNTSQLEPYIKQKPNSYFIFGWNPFLSVYNWGNGKNGGWDRFVRRVGQAPVIFDSTSVTRSVNNIETHLTSLGYYNSRVRDSVKFKNKLASVSYFVTLGNRYIIDSINYVISDSSISKIVLSSSGGSTVKKGDYLSEATLLAESERVASILRNRGYYDFSKNYLFFTADTLRNNGLASLTITINNYTRNESPKDSKRHRVYKINNLFIHPDYNPVTRIIDSTQTADTTHYKDLQIIHSKPISLRKKVLASINRIQPGRIYHENSVNNTYNRFNDLRIYSGVNIQFDETASASRDTGLVNCTIRLTPSKSQGYKLNLEASRNSNGLFGVSPAVSYYHKNLFGGGEWFTLGFMGNFQFKLDDPTRSTEMGFSTSLSVPNFLFIPDKIFKTYLPRTDIGVVYNYQNRPEYTRNLISFNFGYNWRGGKRFYYRVNPLQLSIVRLFNMNSTFYENLKDPFLRNSYRNYFDLGAGGTIFYTTNPDQKKGRSNFYIRWSNDLSGNILSLFNKNMPIDTSGSRTIWGTAYSQYYKGEITAVKTIFLTPKRSVAFRANAGIGYAYGNSKSIPFEKLFYAGGANSMRGWQARTLGPGSSSIDTTFTIPNQTGDIKLEVNAEYRFPLFWKIEGALFMDAGNVWTIRSEKDREEGQFHWSDFYRKIAFNWGFGTRLNLDFLILRLDLGMVAYDPSKKLWISPSKWFKNDTFAFQFGVGYPF